MLLLIVVVVDTFAAVDAVDTFAAVDAVGRYC
jgi:hypothetical protein